jgi:biopolymer transport protein ExbD
MGELNIIPYLDIMMNIIVFTIATITVVFVSTIDTTPPAAGAGRGTRKASKALNLTALITSDGIGLKTSSGNIATGCTGLGSGITIPRKSETAHDYAELTRCARRLKDENERFADESQVTMTANPGVEYQVIVDAMDALRRDDKGELFPDVYFGVPR